MDSAEQEQAPGLGQDTMVGADLEQQQQDATSAGSETQAQGAGAETWQPEPISFDEPSPGSAGASASASMHRSTSFASGGGQVRPKTSQSSRPPMGRSSLQDLRTLRTSHENKRPAQFASGGGGGGASSTTNRRSSDLVGSSGGGGGGAAGRSSGSAPSLASVVQQDQIRLAAQQSPAASFATTERARVQDVEGFAEASMSTLTAIDKVQHGLVKGTITIMSPAFTAQSCLPSFMKRPHDPQQALLEATSLASSGAAAAGESLIPESGKETHRTIAMDKLTAQTQKSLHSIQEKLIRTRDMVDGSSISFQGTAPETSEIAVVARTHFGQNRIIASRLEIIDGLLKDSIQNARSFWFRQDSLCEGAIATFRALSESVLTNTYSMIARLSFVMQQYFDQQFVAKIHKFQADWDREKRAALERQAQLHKSMYLLIEKQHKFAEQLLYLLRNQAHQLPARERSKAESRLRELTANAHSLFVEARVYYQQAHLSLTLEPLSPVLFERVQKWLIDVQLVLIEMLMPMTSSSASVLSSSAAAIAAETKRAGGGGGGGGRSGGVTAPAVVAGSPAALSSLASKSVLYQFAQRIESGRLSDKAAALLMEPKSDVVSDVLQSFVHFYNDRNDKLRAAAQENVNRLNASLHTLQQQVTHAQKLRDEHFARHPSSAATSSAGGGFGGSTSSSSSTTGVIPSTRSAETVRMLLHMNTDLKALEKQLSDNYNELFKNAQPELMRFQEQQNDTVHVVSYLRDFKALVREWDALVKAEMDHCSLWFAKSLTQSRFVTDEFLGWNHFVTAQIDNLGTTIELFATNLFYQMQQLVYDWVTMHVQKSQTRQADFETELQLIETQVEGLRENDQINLADRISRLMQQVREWVDSNNFAKLAACQSGWLAEFDRHIVCLQQLADKWSSDGGAAGAAIAAGAAPRDALLAFLHTLDIMYETTDFGVQATVDRQLQEQESKRVAYSSQKLMGTTSSSGSGSNRNRLVTLQQQQQQQQPTSRPASAASSLSLSARPRPASASASPSTAPSTRMMLGSIAAQAARPVQGQRVIPPSLSSARPASNNKSAQTVTSRAVASSAAMSAEAAGAAAMMAAPLTASLKQRLFGGGGGGGSSKPSGGRPGITSAPGKQVLIQDQLNLIRSSGAGGALPPGSQRFV